MWIKTTARPGRTDTPQPRLVNSDEITLIYMASPYAREGEPFAPYINSTQGHLYYPDSTAPIVTQFNNCVKALNYISHCLNQYQTVGTARSFICDLTGNLSTLDVPTLSHEIGTQSMFHPSAQTVDFSETFTGEELSYAVTSSDTGIVTASISATPTTIALQSVSTGTATLTLTATNEAGSVSTEFTVNVR